MADSSKFSSAYLTSTPKKNNNDEQTEKEAVTKSFLDQPLLSSIDISDDQIDSYTNMFGNETIESETVIKCDSNKTSFLNNDDKEESTLKFKGLLEKSATESEIFDEKSQSAGLSFNIYGRLEDIPVSPNLKHRVRQRLFSLVNSIDDENRNNPCSTSTSASIDPLNNTEKNTDLLCSRSSKALTSLLESQVGNINLQNEELYQSKLSILLENKDKVMKNKICVYEEDLKSAINIIKQLELDREQIEMDHCEDVKKLHDLYGKVMFKQQSDKAENNAHKSSKFNENLNIYKNKSLNNEFGYNDKIQNLQKVIDKLTFENANLKEKQKENESKEKVHHLQLENLQLINENLELKKCLSILEETELKLNRAEGKMMTLQLEKSRLKDELQVCKCDLIKANNETYQMKVHQQKEFAGFKSEYDSLKLLLQDKELGFKEQSEQYSKAIDALKDRLIRTLNENESLKLRLDEDVADVNNLHMCLKSAKDEIIQLEKQKFKGQEKLLSLNENNNHHMIEMEATHLQEVMELKLKLEMCSKVIKEKDALVEKLIQDYETQLNFAEKDNKLNFAQLLEYKAAVKILKKRLKEYSR